MNINGINYYWNHTDGGSFLEIRSTANFSTSFFLSNSEINLFLHGLDCALAKIPIQKTEYAYSAIQLNPGFSVSIGINDLECSIVLKHEPWLGATAIFMTPYDLIALKNFLDETKSEALKKNDKH